MWLARQGRSAHVTQAIKGGEGPKGGWMPKKGNVGFIPTEGVVLCAWIMTAIICYTKKG